MARRLNMAVVMLIIVSALLKTTKAQTTHTVGDALGWQVPSAGSATYATWASTQTFTVGDLLFFNFTTGQHDVAEVNSAAFLSCNSNSPIFMITTGPATIPLNSTGLHYYICTFGSHCSLGQRLAINVSAASTSPAPQPAITPVPAPSPTATPPSSSATPPSTPAPSPTSIATPPSGSATPPSSPAPSSMPTPPSGSATPPSGTTNPSTTNPNGISPTSAPGNSAPSFAPAALPVAVLSMALAFFY